MTASSRQPQGRRPANPGLAISKLRFYSPQVFGAATQLYDWRTWDGAEGSRLVA
jgi:hypothetical protein